MNLKEAFRFQNKITTLIDEAVQILSVDENITQVSTTYFRKKVMPEVENETTIDTPPSEFANEITELAAFIMHLMAERERLFAVIREAKQALPIDMDNEVSLNSKRQAVARAFSRMVDLRNSENLIPNGGVGYRFNQEGNQVTYRCDVKRVTTIHFNRTIIRNFASEINRKADAVSVELDRCMVNSTVHYEAPFDVNDSFAEIFNAFVATYQPS